MSRKLSEFILDLSSLSLSWEEFEEFICQFVQALDSVRSSNLYGRRGQSQKGIDGEVEFKNEDLGVFQCKQVSSWSGSKTKQAVEYANDNFPDLNRYILVISCKAGTDSRDEIKKHDNWELWDCEDLSRKFRPSSSSTDFVSEEDGIRIVGSWFGSQRVKDFFGKEVNFALKHFNRRYRAELNESSRLFHHQTEFQGRESCMEALNQFVSGDQKVAVLMGRGGLGKTRLLIEFSSSFPKNHSGCVLRILSQEGVLRPEELMGFANNKIVIVIEDAHRRDDLRELIFTATLSGFPVKLVLETRPSGTNYIQSEIAGTTVDETQVSHFPELRELKPIECHALCKSLLADDKKSLAKQLASFSRDCPLVAVIGSYILNSSATSVEILETEEEFRKAILNRFTEEIHDISAGDSTRKEILRKTLRVISALQPLDIEGVVNDVTGEVSVVSKIATFVGTEEDDLEELISFLQSQGVISGERMLRIVPETLSDFILFDACFNANGKPTRFSKKIAEAFPVLGNLLRNLATVDWLNLRKAQPTEKSIIQEIWPIYRDHFTNSRFYERIRLIEIAYQNHLAALAPELAEELVTLSFQLQDQPEPDDDEIFVPMKEMVELGGMFNFRTADYLAVVWNSFKLVEQIAFYNFEKLEECLSLLWAYAKNGPSQINQMTDHPYRRIQSVAKLEWTGIESPKLYYASIDRVTLAADWICKIVLDPDERDCTNSPIDLLSILLNRTSEQTWMEGNRFCSRAFVVPFEVVKTIREKVRRTLEILMLEGDNSTATEALELAKKELWEIGQYSYLDIGEDEKKTWLPDRIAFAESLIHVHNTTKNSSLRYKIWLTFKKFRIPEFANLEGLPSSEIPDDLEFQALIVLFANRDAIRDFGEGCDYEKREEEWKEFGESVAAQVWEKNPSAIEFCNFLNTVSESIQGDSWESAHPFILFLKDNKPELFREVCRWTLESSPCFFDGFFNLLVFHAELPEERQDSFLQAAVLSDVPALSESGVRFIWGKSDDESWSKVESSCLRELIERGDSKSSQLFISLFEYGHEHHFSEKLELIFAIDFEENFRLIPNLFDAFEHLHRKSSLDRLMESEAQVRKLLDILVNFPDFTFYDQILAFITAACDEHPKLCYDFLRSRIERGQICSSDEKYTPIPLDKLTNRLTGFQCHKSYPDWLADCLANSKGESESAFYFARLSRLLVANFPDAAVEAFSAELDGDAEAGVDLVLRMLGIHRGYFVFNQPDLVSKILECSKKVSREFHSSTASHLKSGIGPMIRTITSEPDPDDEFAMKRSAELVEEFRDSNQSLSEFYQSIHEMFKAQIQHRLDGHDWIFDD